MDGPNEADSPRRQSPASRGGNRPNDAAEQAADFLALGSCYLQVELERPVKCDDCEWTGLGRELNAVIDIQERIDPGAEVPAGECPKCSALAYVTVANAVYYQTRYGGSES